MRNARAPVAARLRAVLVAFVALAIMQAPRAHAASPIVKPGLWEVTVTTRISETRTEVPELGKAPTGERAKVDADMRRPVVAPDVTRTTRECVTPQAASRWTALTRIDRDYVACTKKPLAQSSKHFKATLACAAGRNTGSAEFSATRESFKGEVSVVSHEPAYDRTETKVVQGTWVARECSDSATPHAAGER